MNESKEPRRTTIPSPPAAGCDGPLLFGLRDSAAMLSISVESVRRLIHRGELNSVKLGGRRLVSSDELRRVASGCAS